MKKRTYYLICMGVILVTAFLMALKGGIFSVHSAEEVFRILADSFFVPGVLFMGCGALGWISSKGTYDMINFGCGRIARNFMPGMDREKYNDFYKYKLMRDEAGRKWKPHLLISGAAAFAAALIFTALYYAVK